MKFKTKFVAGLRTNFFSFEWVKFDMECDPGKNKQVGTFNEVRDSLERLGECFGRGFIITWVGEERL